jgi:hypothetical protein
MAQPVLKAKFRQKLLSVMTKGGVTDIVAKGYRLDEIFVEPQETPDCPGYF